MRGPDAHFPELIRPQLPAIEAGERAAKLMLRRIANPAGGKPSVVWTPILTVRVTVATELISAKNSMQNL